MSTFQVVILPAQGDMDVRVFPSNKMSSVVFTDFVNKYIREQLADSLDDEEIDAELDMMWTYHEVSVNTHMVRTEAETIIMVELM